ncbi:MAG: hypothetical protein N3E46_09065, partial [Gemmataceae bacterium]|nr:hypothetical protein [Gemmataceae bacterium]
MDRTLSVLQTLHHQRRPPVTEEGEEPIGGLETAKLQGPAGDKREEKGVVVGGRGVKRRLRRVIK